jgi:hypothetical protein
MELSKILNDTIVIPSPSSPTHHTISSDDESVHSVTHSNLRIGKWTEEEEAFAMEMVKQFTSGALNIPTGTSLRSYLAKKLRCSPMRISTKLSMELLNGMRIQKKLGQKRFFPTPMPDALRQQNRMNLERLERIFLNKEQLEFLPEEDELDSNDNEVSSPTGSTCSSNSSNTSNDHNSPKRIGSWSDEEQLYASALIDGFLKGLLDIPQGTTLRSFLAEQLCCNPMRISKKLATGTMGDRAIPKRLGSTSFHMRRNIDPIEKVAMHHYLTRLRGVCFSVAQPSHQHYQQQNSHHIQPQHQRYMYHQQQQVSELARYNMPSSPTIKRKYCAVDSKQFDPLPTLLELCKRTRTAY